MKIKRYIEDHFYDYINCLSERSGYSRGFLTDMFISYMNDCRADGEGIDLSYFTGVTMERDW